MKKILKDYEFKLCLKCKNLKRNYHNNYFFCDSFKEIINYKNCAVNVCSNFKENKIIEDNKIIGLFYIFLFYLIIKAKK